MLDKRAANLVAPPDRQCSKQYLADEWWTVVLSLPAYTKEDMNNVGMLAAFLVPYRQLKAVALPERVPDEWILALQRHRRAWACLSTGRERVERSSAGAQMKPAAVGNMLATVLGLLTNFSAVLEESVGKGLSFSLFLDRSQMSVRSFRYLNVLATLEMGPVCFLKLLN